MSKSWVGLNEKSGERIGGEVWSDTSALRSLCWCDLGGALTVSILETLWCRRCFGMFWENLWCRSCFGMFWETLWCRRCLESANGRALGGDAPTRIPQTSMLYSKCGHIRYIPLPLSFSIGTLERRPSSLPCSPFS